MRAPERHGFSNQRATYGPAQMPGIPPGVGRAPRRPFPVHPLLLAAFPVLFLFAENVVEQVSTAPLWLPLAAALAWASVLLVTASAVLRDWRRGAVAASTLIVLVFSFGHVRNLSRDAIPDRAHLAVLYVVLALVGLALAWRGGRWVVPLTRSANVAAVLLVAFNAVRIGQFALLPPAPAPAAVAGADATLAAQPSAVARRPDIYYVILDRYSSADTVRRVYGFDNRPFLEELERRGFTIAEESWSNYLKTALSIASSLDMAYLDGAELKERGGGTFGPLYADLRGRLAGPAALKGLGYEYVHIGSSWEPTATNVDADRVLRWAPGGGFSSALLATTAFALTQPEVTAGEDEAPPDSTVELEHHRQDTLFQFARLEESAARPGPTFVFAHILMPHNPWRFNADGSLPTPEQLAARSNEASFVEQIRWTNQRVLGVLDRLLDVPAGEEPVIVIQADEGEFPAAFARDEAGFDWLAASPGEIAQKFGILNAYHLPGVDPAAVGVHDRISPVNAFRVVFNAYFDAGLPLLPDVTWLSPDYAHIYDFVEYARP